MGPGLRGDDDGGADDASRPAHAHTSDMPTPGVFAHRYAPELIDALDALFAGTTHPAATVASAPSAASGGGSGMGQAEPRHESSPR